MQIVKRGCHFAEHLFFVCVCVFLCSTEGAQKTKGATGWIKNFLYLKKKKKKLHVSPIAFPITCFSITF